MAKKLLRPEALRDFLARRYNNQHQCWLAGGGTWPLNISLGAPTEKEVVDDPGAVRDWVAAWSEWKGPADIVWESRQWPRLGRQRFPTSLCVPSPEAVVATIGKSARWSLASGRYRRMIARWPVLAHRSVLTSKFDVLADYSAEDFERLVLLLTWLEDNAASNLYLRQLPVLGLDTKWIGQRTRVVADLVCALVDGREESDFHKLCGLRKPPDRIRIRVLCPELRERVAGLRDIEAPVEELASLPLAPLVCLIVENLETGLAVPDMPGVVCIMKLGNAVALLSQLGWLQNTRVVYWGDIDTHGYAILDRARRILPQLQSILMDEATLLAHLALCGRESAQCPDIELEQLTPEERHVYRGLRVDAWGERLRLEQERLPWDTAVAVLKTVLSRKEDTTPLVDRGTLKRSP